MTRLPRFSSVPMVENCMYIFFLTFRDRKVVNYTFKNSFSKKIKVNDELCLILGILIESSSDPCSDPQPNAFNQMTHKPQAPKKKIRDFFDGHLDNGKKKLKCKTCSKVIADCNNTTNLHNHFSNHHFKIHKANFPEKYGDANNKTSETQETNSGPPTKKFKKAATVTEMFQYQNSYARK